MLVFKDLGLVSQVFEEQTLAAMEGHVAIGHCRYSTTGQTTWENAQPVFRNTAAGTGVAFGHNGNIVNSAELVTRARAAGLVNTRVPGTATTDSDMLGALLAHGAADSSLEQAALELLPTVRGAFCLTFMDENTLYAARDPHGVRPLSLGDGGPRLGGGVVETAALDIVGASFARRHRAGRAPGYRRRWCPVDPLRQSRTQGRPHFRIRLPGAAGQHDRRQVGARRPA